MSTHPDEAEDTREDPIPSAQPVDPTSGEIAQAAVDHPTYGSTNTAGGPVAPPGWYPTPEGRQRYWNGSDWLDIPVPPGPNNTTSRKSRKLSTRSKWIIVAAAILILALAGGGVAWKISSDAAAAQVAAEEEAKREAEAERIADNERAQKEREEAEAEAERERRTASVSSIEASVKEMAEGHAADGLIEGPILEVSCSPVDGGSLDDIAEQTTVFECFVANQDNGDGTMNGYTYNATMNWTTGSYTYGLGAP